MIYIKFVKIRDAARCALYGYFKRNIRFEGNCSYVNVFTYMMSAFIFILVIR